MVGSTHHRASSLTLAPQISCPFPTLLHFCPHPYPFQFIKLAVAYIEFDTCLCYSSASTCVWIGGCGLWGSTRLYFHPKPIISYIFFRAVPFYRVCLCVCIVVITCTYTLVSSVGWHHLKQWGILRKRQDREDQRVTLKRAAFRFVFVYLGNMYKGWFRAF